MIWSAARRFAPVSLLMLAVVALFPVGLLAILLVTSGLEGRFVSTKGARRARRD
jgi:hypothetical protein